jgi:beta-lactamase class D OXA-209
MKKPIQFLASALLFLGFCSCSDPDISNTDVEETEPSEILKPEIAQILQNYDVAGSVLIFDPETFTYYSNDFDWARKPCSPASTFKIPNSIIALETGVLESDTSVFKWDGAPRRQAKWEKDLTLKEAFQVSCVPCYQEVARKVGLDRMRNMLDKLKYPGMVFDSTTIDNFWLEGASEITQFEQIDFLERFYFSELPISKRTETIMKDIMIIETAENYELSGKSGWTFRGEMNVGWLVGYLERKGKVYFFATNIEKAEATMETFPQIRIGVTLDAFEVLGLVK